MPRRVNRAGPPSVQSGVGQERGAPGGVGGDAGGAGGSGAPDPVGGAGAAGGSGAAGGPHGAAAAGARLDDAALRLLHDEHRTALRIVALRMCDGDAGRADDAVQEAFIRAWQHPEVLDASRGSTRGWLLTTLRRILVDAHRAREARPQVTTDIVPELPPGGPAVSDVDRMLEQTVVLDALAALAQPHREAIVECYYRGSTVVEAAQRLGVPPGTIKSRLFYGLRALRGALIERGVHA